MEGEAPPNRAPLTERDLRIVATLRAKAANPDLMGLLDDREVLSMWHGVVANLGQRGSAGSSDRAALSRAIGLDWYGAPGRLAKGDATGRLSALADKLERALARAEAANGHAAVTQADDNGTEPAEDGASEGDAHQMQDHARYLPRQIEAGNTPPPPRVGEEWSDGSDDSEMGGE